MIKGKARETGGKERKIMAINLVTKYSDRSQRASKRLLSPGGIQ